MVEKSVIKIPVDKIHPNSWNPFSMKPELFEALVRHIQKEELLGHIIVRPCDCPQIQGSHYEVIDGEHRLIAVQDRRVDLKEIPCLVEDKDDVEARLETLNFNLEHGEVVPEKFEALVRELESSARLSREQLADRLFISQEELKLHLAPVKIVPDAAPKIELTARNPTFTISARMHSRTDYDFVNSILKDIKEREECDEASAMLAVFRAWQQGK